MARPWLNILSSSKASNPFSDQKEVSEFVKVLGGGGNAPLFINILLGI
jgi:hypothetical protein